MKTLRWLWGLTKLYITMKVMGISVDLRGRFMKKNFIMHPGLELRKAARMAQKQVDLEISPVRQKEFRKIADNLTASAEQLEAASVLALAFFPDKINPGFDEVPED